jgi:hypothetical protein
VDRLLMRLKTCGRHSHCVHCGEEMEKKGPRSPGCPTGLHANGAVIHLTSREAVMGAQPDILLMAVHAQWWKAVQHCQQGGSAPLCCVAVSTQQVHTSTMRQHFPSHVPHSLTYSLTHARMNATSTISITTHSLTHSPTLTWCLLPT